MAYVMFQIPSPEMKVEPTETETLEDAHKYCKQNPYGIWIILEGTSLFELETKMGTPVALYIKGKQHNLIPVDE
jgi:hypothetical protein